MNQDEQDRLKAQVGRAALAYVVPGQPVGVGTGSTVNHFIAALGAMKSQIPGAVSSSERSSALLREQGIPVFEAGEVQRLAVYIDGADESKRVPVLGRFPLPVEVIAMAAPQITRRFAALGGTATLRPGVRTDNGHPILDVRGLSITDPAALEAEINQWPGVVCVGIFARHRAHTCLLGTPVGVQTLVF
jgi:ribose 5-phosphate isomerase A